MSPCCQSEIGEVLLGWEHEEAYTGYYCKKCGQQVPNPNGSSKE